MNRLIAPIVTAAVLLLLSVATGGITTPTGPLALLAGLVLLTDLTALPVPRRGFLSNSFVWLYLLAQLGGVGVAAITTSVSLLIRYMFLGRDEFEARARHLLSEVLPSLSGLLVLALMRDQAGHGFPSGLLPAVVSLVAFYGVGRLALRVLYRDAVGPQRELLKQATYSRELQLRISTVLAPAAVQLADAGLWRSVWILPVLLGVHQFFWEKLSRVRELSEEGSRRLGKLKQRESELHRRSAQLSRTENEKDLLQRCLEDFSSSADMRTTAQAVLKLAAQIGSARGYALFWNSAGGFRPILALNALMQEQEIDQESFSDGSLLRRCFQKKDVVSSAGGDVWCFPLHEDGLLYLGGVKSRLNTTQQSSLALLARQATFGLRSAVLFEQLSDTVKEANAARKQAEAARRELEVSQAHLVQSSKLAAAGQLAAGVAHELNSPLAAALVAVQAARRSLRKGKTETVEARFDQCEQSLEKARAIADGLLSRCRGSDRETRPVSLQEMVDETVRFLADGLQKTGVQICLQLSPDATVTVNPDEITQILTNLIVNAQQAMKEVSSKKLTVALIVDETKAHLDVVDGGVGVSAEHRDKIFQPFFTTKTGGEGTGLGLYLSSELAKRNGGSLSLLESHSSGSTFRLTFERS